MTTRRFPFKESNGEITIIIPAPKSKRENESEEEWIQRVVGRAIRQFEMNEGPCELLPEIDTADLPSREYRKAWRANQDGSIRVDETEKQKIIEERETLETENLTRG